MLSLKENQVCPHSSKCPYNKLNQCYGANSTRSWEFKCEWVVHGRIVEGQGVRLPGDKTGQMKVIME